MITAQRLQNDKTGTIAFIRAAMKATTTTEDTTDKFCIKMLHSLLPCHSYAYTFLLTVHDQNLNLN